MLNDRQILHRLQALPEPLKAEVVHYMEFLQSKYAQADEKQSPRRKRRPAPELAGALTITGDLIAPVAEDDWESNV